MAAFQKTKEAISLIEKATSNGHSIDIEINDNFIVDKAKDTHSYEASLTAAFIRWLLYENNKSFSFETVMSHPSTIKEIGGRQKERLQGLLIFCVHRQSGNQCKKSCNKSRKGRAFGRYQ